MSAIDVRQSQLFVDDNQIEHQTLLERVVHSPVRSRLNPLMTPEKPWEMPSFSYIVGVYRDEATAQFRAWTLSTTNVYPGYETFLSVLTSDDGVNWERPAFDFYRHVTGGPSNIVHASPHYWDSPTILHDPEDAERPWKIVLWQHRSVFVGHSTDGLHWSVPTEPSDAFIPGFGDRTTAFVDRGNPERYVILSRNRQDQQQRQLVRSIYRLGSMDWRTISSPSDLVLRPDLEDGPYVEFYHMGGFQYESLYLGLIERYHTVELPFSDVELTVSRDTRTWHRVRPRTPFFAPPPHGHETGAWDMACSTPTFSPPIRMINQTTDYVVDSLWFYYYGGASFHGDNFMTHDRCMGLAKLRIDGFASLRAGRREGQVTTRPFRWPGGTLQVNARVLGGNLWRYTDRLTSDGYVVVEVLDASGAVIPGYARDECDPLYIDKVAYVPTWSGQPQNLEGLIGETVALRFLLRSAELYSFRAAPVQPTTSRLVELGIAS